MRKGPYKDLHGKKMDGSISNTLIGMKKKTASKIAGQIIDLYCKLQNYNEE